MWSRGKWHTPQRAAQARDYSGLLYGAITPTDLDGLLDFHNAFWVLFELKLAGTPLPYGQRLALQRLCRDLARVKPAYVLVAEHETRAEQPIQAADCWLVEYHNGSAWITPRLGLTLKEAIHLLRRKHLPQAEVTP